MLDSIYYKIFNLIGLKLPKYKFCLYQYNRFQLKCCSDFPIEIGDYIFLTLLSPFMGLK